MRTSTFASPGPARRRRRLGLRLAVLVAGALTLGLLTPVPASAAPAQLIARDGAFYEYNDAVVRIALARRVNHRVSVGYRTLSGTAVDGVDFIGKTGRVSFPAGTKVRKVRISLVDDSADEPNEAFRLRLFEPRRATVLDRTARVTIIDDDELLMTVSDRTELESHDTMSFTVNLSYDPSHDVTFKWATLNGSAVADSDFGLVSSRSETITSGTSKTLTVNLVNDTGDEVDETFGIVITDVVGARLADGTAVGRIIDDDSPVLSVPEAASVFEGSSVTVRVTLALASTESVTVDYDTADGAGSTGADEGVDFTAADGSLTFSPGQTVKDIVISTVADGDTSSETFTFTLSNPSPNARLGNATTTVTITAQP